MTQSNNPLLEKIRAALYADTLVDLSQIIIELCDGTVKISGTVPSLAALNAAENDVLSVEGVTSIENNLKVVYPGETNKIADQNLKKQVIEALHAYTSADDNVKIDIQNGVITLDGYVKTDEEKEKIPLVVKKTAGSVVIIDKIAVVSSQFDSDRSIAEKIRAELDKTDPLNYSDFVLHVDKGTVTIDGKVQDWNEFNRIEFLIKQIPGVSEVKNRMILN